MRILLSILLCFAFAAVSAQRHYVCYYTSSPLKIDGVASEAAWQKAAWTEDFVDIEGDVRPRPPLRTRVKMLWDSVNLYVFAELQEPDLWSELRQHDTVVYRDNDFEVFIDPDNDTHNYFELEINPLGTVMDLFLPKPYRNGGRALLSWDAQGLRSAVKVSGTLNHPGDNDKGWTTEMAIPLSNFRSFERHGISDSTLFRINFSRVEWDRDVVKGRYVVRVDSGLRRLPEHNWVWSPQGAIAMHMPEKWGYLAFSSRPVGSDTVAFVLPAAEGGRAVLWELFYAQQKYRAEHGEYAVSLGALGLSSRGGILELIATPLQYTALLKWDGVSGHIMIDQDGKVGVIR